jgi:small subunit ribosomal protein S19e
VLRKISITDSMGVSRLRGEYGGRKNRGHKPEHKFKGSGSVIRKVVQQLEAAGFVRKEKNKGRVVTDKGRAFLSEAGKEIRKKA